MSKPDIGVESSALRQFFSAPTGLRNEIRELGRPEPHEEARRHKRVKMSKHAWETVSV